MIYKFRGKSFNGWEYGGVNEKQDAIISHHIFIPVDPASVGQFIGLTDITGQEIYQGDVVTYNGMKNAEGYPMFFIVTSTTWNQLVLKPYLGQPTPFIPSSDAVLKVIGNIIDGFI